MGMGMKVGLVVIVLIVLGLVSVVGAIIGVNNTCVSYEQSIIAQYKQNQNNYDNFFKKVKEVAQVPDIYVADFKKVYDGIMQGRYGSEGSKAAFQWIQENNPALDSSIYKQVQQVIEAGRENFEINQKTLLDKKRVYQTYIGVFPNNFISRIVGFPRIELDKYDIVTSDVTQQVFEEKKSEPLTIRD